MSDASLINITGTITMNGKSYLCTDIVINLVCNNAPSVTFKIYNVTDTDVELVNTSLSTILELRSTCLDIMQMAPASPPITLEVEPDTIAGDALLPSFSLQLYLTQCSVHFNPNSGAYASITASTDINMLTIFDASIYKKFVNPKVVKDAFITGDRNTNNVYALQVTDDDNVSTVNNVIITLLDKATSQFTENLENVTNERLKEQYTAANTLNLEYYSQIKEILTNSENDKSEFIIGDLKNVSSPSRESIINHISNILFNGSGSLFENILMIYRDFFINYYPAKLSGGKVSQIHLFKLDPYTSFDDVKSDSKGALPMFLSSFNSGTGNVIKNIINPKAVIITSPLYNTYVTKSAFLKDEVSGRYDDTSKEFGLINTYPAPGWVRFETATVTKNEGSTPSTANTAKTDLDLDNATNKNTTKSRKNTNHITIETEAESKVDKLSTENIDLLDTIAQYTYNKITLDSYTATLVGLLTTSSTSDINIGDYIDIKVVSANNGTTDLCSGLLNGIEFSLSPNSYAFSLELKATEFE